MLSNFINKIDLNYKETIILLKRLNRVMPVPIYDEKENINCSDLLKPQETLTLLENKYSLQTTINTIHFIIKLLKYFTNEPTVIDAYNNIYNDLISVKEFPNLYIKMTMVDLQQFIKQKYLEYCVDCSHTKVRNLLLLSLLVNYPLKLNSLINLNYICYEGANIDDAELNAVSIINNNSDCSLVLNELSISKRKVFKILDNQFLKILKLFTSRFKRGCYLICSVEGKVLSKSNLCNGLVNYTRKEIGTPLSIFDVKNIWKSENKTKKELIDLFFT